MEDTVILPGPATIRMSDTARGNLLDLPSLPIETFTTVEYVGSNGGVVGTGLFVEVDADTWVENDLFTFQEVSETEDQVVLFDPSRGVTITIDYDTQDLTVAFGSTQLFWDVVGVQESLSPVIPVDWLV